ncbi:MAG TPA: outer membrane protein assembly factor BamD [Prolixibacteraceae bacterium]|nr:outer membrane protein assembly factor BamD [Prolixibacteraceae bacterium]HPS13705.1 outer membrane protein assembly factor BamD [Prolixibacteraceae bacterium]
MDKKWIFLLILSSFLVSCGEFNNVLKSTDYEYKFKKGVEYYQAKDYNHAITLFEELVYAFRGTSKGDDLYYYYANSCYNQGDYLLSGHYFKSIVEQYPRSEYAEEAQFMIGMCFFKDSPDPMLDQEVTLKAIDALQLYINMYPYSTKRVEEARMLIDELNEKIVYKSFLSARLYFDMGYYKSSVIALNNSLNDHPITKHREEIKFLLFKSKYLLGVNSIEEKKRERLNDAMDEYFTFVDEFPDSKYTKEVKRDYAQIKVLLGIEQQTSTTIN